MLPTLIPHHRETNLRHVLKRAGLGVNAAELERIRSQGWRYWLEEQMSDTIDDPAERRASDILPKSLWGNRQVWDSVKGGMMGQYQWDPMFELGAATILRYCWSPRRLQEVMVEFWGNHFNITCPSNAVWDWRMDYERDVLRKHTFGKFEDMLIASAHHPAMLRYLDGTTNRVWAPNENYGRELLELHTVGVGNYTENDVWSAARLFTGWDVPDAPGPGGFHPDWHDAGGETIMGYTVRPHANSAGVEEQRKFLRWLTRHPATARSLAYKLCVRFIADNPPEDIVQAVTAAWIASSGDIKTVLRSLFTHPTFWQSQARKLRRPLEDLAATVIALNLPMPNHGQGMLDLYWMIAQTGQQPYRRPFPDGYPDTAQGWLSSGAQLQLWNNHILLASGYYPDKLQLPHFSTRMPNPKPRTPRDMVDHLEELLYLERLTDLEREQIYSYMKLPADHVFESWNMWINNSYPELIAFALDLPRFRVR